MDANRIEAIFPMAPQQQGIFLEARASVGTGLHIEQAVQCLPGALNVATFERAWQQVVARHAMLRTAFVSKPQGEPVQIVLRSVASPVRAEDWRHLAPEQQEQRLEAYLQADRADGFELNRPPLVRLALFRTDDLTFQFVRTYHHLVVDGWSIPILNRDLETFYSALLQGRAPKLETARTYRDFVAWLQHRDRSPDRAYWTSSLHDWRQPTALGCKPVANVPRTDEPHSYATVELSWEQDRFEALQSLARRNRVTLNTIVQAAWALLLARYSGDQDVVFGTTVSGRPPDLPGVENTVGLFINTLPFRVNVPPDAPLGSWLSTLQATHLRLRDFEHCSTGQIQEWIEMPAAVPLYESALVYENYPKAEPSEFSETLGIEDVRNARLIGARTRFAVTLLAIAHEGLLLRLVYDRRRFAGDSGDSVVEHLSVILSKMILAGDICLSELLGAIPADTIPTFRPIDRTPGSESPRTSHEAVVAEICRQLLGLPYVGIHDNLLLLGAHSLIAAQVVARIRNRLNIELPLSTVFEYPTIASLAREIEARHGAPQSDPLTVPRPARRDQPLPLSTAQQRLWLLDQLDPGLSVYNAAARIRLTGRLDRAALETSLAAVVTRHEALRTVFATNGDEPIQVVRPPAPVALPFTDLRSLRTDRRNHEIEALARGEAAQPFDLECDLMIRARLLQVQDEEHILLLTLHHIASDRWSFNVLLQEIHALYARACGTQTPPLQDLPVQYADYALWERSTLEPTVYRRQLEYWRIQLGDLAEAPLLPPDQPRGDTQTFTGATLHSEFPADLVTTLNELARRLHATTYMALLAAFHLLLNVRTDQSTIATGTNVANRTHLELEGLIGFFVNQIVLRSDLSGNPTFLETLAQLRETVLQGYAHQQVPFDLVVADQKRARTANSSPLFQILFVQNTLISPLKQGDLTIHPPEFDSSTSKFDLAVFAEEAQGTLRLTWIYKADLFRASTIARLAQQFAQIVATVVREPEITRDALKSRLAQMDREERSDVARDRDVTSRRLLKSVVPKSVSPDPD